MRSSVEITSQRVLIAGGRPHAVRLLRQIFEMLGVRLVHQSGFVNGAVELLRTHRFVAVFCDENLEDARAGDFIHAARRSPGLVDPLLPIFLVCSGPKRKDIEAARDLGFTDVLTRPVSAATILRKIRSATGNPRPFIVAGAFFGPDRRTGARGFAGGERRTRQPKKVRLPHPGETAVIED